VQPGRVEQASELATHEELDQLIGPISLLPGAHARQDGGIQIALAYEGAIQTPQEEVLLVSRRARSRHWRAKLGGDEAQLA
jgi:hypothetical protein